MSHRPNDEREMARRVAELDWSTTPLGPSRLVGEPAQIAVRILLTSQFAMWMAWGPELTMLYNDAYRRNTLGAKHPWALGQPGERGLGGDLGATSARASTRVLASGVATWDEDLLLFLERSGYPEETYHTFSYSPLTDDDGAVAGMLCVVTEETDRVLGTADGHRCASRGSDLAVTAGAGDAVDGRGAPAARTRAISRSRWSTCRRRRPTARLRRPGAPASRRPRSTPVPQAASAGVLRRPRPMVGLEDLASGPADRRPWDRSARPGRRACRCAQPGQDRPARFLVAGLNPLPAARRALPRLPRPGRRPDRRRARQRPRLRGRTPPRGGAGRAGPGEDRRSSPTSATSSAPRSRCCSGPLEELLRRPGRCRAGRAAERSTSPTATGCGSPSW